jgi:hypothetical protein
MEKQRRHAGYSIFSPKSPTDAARWYHEQKEKKRVVYWDKVKKEMISSDDSDLRNLPVEDRSKVARIYSEANIIDLLTSHWKSTPIAEGSNGRGRVVSYKGHKYEIRDRGVFQENKERCKEGLY